MITTILLIVVVFVLIGMILTWGKGFIINSVSTTANVYNKSDLAGYIYVTTTLNPQSTGEGRNRVVINNLHKTSDVKIIGYKIISNINNDYSFINSLQILDENIILQANNKSEVMSIACFPERNFKIQLYTSANTYIDTIVNVDNFDSTSCDFYNNNKPFVKTIGGTDTDQIKSVEQLSDNSYVFAGYTKSLGPGNKSFWIVKTDSQGNEDWNSVFGGVLEDRAYSVKATSDNGFILAGSTFSFANNANAAWIVKTDSQGNEDWNSVFDGPSYEGAIYAEETDDNGYIVIGTTYSYGNGAGDIWLIKTDSLGNEDWNKTFGGTLNDQGFSVKQTNDGGYILTGFTKSLGDSSTGDVWLIKTDSLGNEDWNSTFGSIGKVDFGTDVIQTSNGGYVITGYTASLGVGEEDVWLIKTDSLGNEDWNKTFGGSSNNEGGNSVKQTSDGGYIVIAYLNSFGAGNEDVWLIKTDSKGNEDWNKSFGSTATDYGGGVFQTSDNGYIISGYTDSYGNGSGDAWIIKTDSKGNTCDFNSGNGSCSS